MPLVVTTQVRRGTTALSLALILSMLSWLGTSHAAPRSTDLGSARARLQEFESDFQAVRTEYERVRSELDRIDRAMSKVERVIRGVARRMGGKERAAVNLAVELYKGGSGTTGIEGVLSSRSLVDLDKTMTYLAASEQAHSKVFERLEIDYEVLDENLADLEKARIIADKTEGRLAELRSDVSNKVSQLQNEVAGLEAAALAAERRRAEQAAAQVQQVIVDDAVRHPVPGPPYHADWEAIAMCESGGNWHIDSTYDGGLQFHPLTWLGYGGGKYARYAWQATKAEQIAIAEVVLREQGPGAWPNCFKSL